MKAPSSHLFSWRQILIATAAFLGIVILMQRTQRYVCENWIPFDCPYYWPVSVFSPRFPSPRDLVVAGLVTIAFFIIYRFLEARGFNIWLASLCGVLLIAGLTFIHGTDVGFYAPIAGDAQSGVLIPYSADGQEYYHDALTINDPVDFLRRYNEIQPTLHRHAHTHPPGAVLTFYVLAKVLRDPGLIALFIMIVATVPTVFFFYRLMQAEVSPETARYMAFVITLLPVVQIYYLATLDALVAALLTGVLYLFCFGRGRMAIAGASLLLTASFLLTFVSLFILPVLVGFEMILKRSAKRSLVVISVLIFAHVGLYLLTGYNAMQSFHTASLFENPQGYLLLADPVNYIITRLEDVSEILFFFGPFLMILFVRGSRGIGAVRDIHQRPLYVLTALGCLTIAGMYAVGAWRTGETARASAFIYPYLLFPVGTYLEDQGVGRTGLLQLAALVFLQSVGMQSFGNYFW